MTATLTVRDETATGAVLHQRTLDFLDEDVTVRELITRRVQEEVREYNRTADRAMFVGLVQPTDAEAALNGYRMRTRRELSWERQRDAALAAFRANGFFVLVGDRQVESLDERIHIGLGTEVSFVKLVPLVGG
jgi:wobble nucleotide-excising tRNase